MYTGKVKRPDFETGDKSVKLTATVSKGLVTKTISFDTIVKKLGITDGQSVIKDLSWIVIPSETKTNLVLPITGPNDSKISWSSKTPATISNTGLVSRPAVEQPNVDVVLTATVTKGDETQTKEFTVKVFAWTTEDELEDAKKLITWDLIHGTNSSINMVISNLVLPAKLGREAVITWTTSNTDFCSSSGVITRPTYTQGPVIISVTATLSKSGKEIKQTITGIRLEPAAITNTEIALDAINRLDATLFIGANTSLDQIKEDMILPLTVPNQLSPACVLGWTVVDDGDSPASTPYVKLQATASNVKCTIVRPDSSSGNQIFYLKATATANDGTAGGSGTSYKRFRIVVIANAPVV